jgi:hypothetical protein
MTDTTRVGNKEGGGQNEIIDEEYIRREKLKIERADTSMKAMKLGKPMNSCVPGWDSIKKMVMRVVLYAKLQYCEPFRRALRESGTRPLVEETGHPFWGGRGKGGNEMGLLLEEMRGRLYREGTNIPIRLIPDVPNLQQQVVIMGDSIVGRYSVEEGLSLYLKGKVAVCSKGGLHADEANINMLNAELRGKQLALENTDVLVVHVGINDIPDQAAPEDADWLAEELIDQLDRIWKEAKKVKINMRMVWSNMIPRPRSSVLANSTINNVNDMVSKVLSARGWTIIFHGPSFIEKNGEIREFYYGPDLVHLNEAGVTYLVWDLVNQLQDQGLVVNMGMRGGGTRRLGSISLTNRELPSGQNNPN